MRSPLITVAVIVMMATPGFAQKRSKHVVVRADSSASATSVSAELIRGKLNPAESKPGDQVTIRLKDDVKSNGDLVLSKGTVITGVVRNASLIDDVKETRPTAHSFIEIQWITPPSQSGGSRELMVAVQSVLQLSLLTPQESSDADLNATAAASRPSRGLALVNDSREVTAGAAPQSNVALMKMPSVVAADTQTANSLHAEFGVADSQLFQTGHGKVVTASGSKESIDIFSHLNNDTVLTSPGKAFEISSGAELRLLVGINKR